ncbi:hypothetical protein AC578_8795 [Pseudocercospora eumusae]|uniref:Uncharacterized protein n=1 Tax=Pseudocercospora eumusae TaxID=321146 RepID=A0A139H6I3_9PEZI|nr:hypothetical protein AC578_8795 [Pseudocercospora eumusae]
MYRSFSEISWPKGVRDEKWLGGSVVFHKPHPDPELDPIILHAMGKRLHKWFGRDRDSFVEREKVAKEDQND